MADKKIRYEITADSTGFEKGFKRAADSTGVLDNAVQGVSRSVVALGATYLGAQGIGAIIKTADTYTNLDSKLKLATKSSAEFASSYDALFKMSQKTGSSFEANVTAFSGLAMAMKGTKVPTEELLSVFEDVNKSLVVAGASTVEASSFLLQFKQALGSNRLSGDEFKAMLEANSYWAGKFATALDTDMAGLYKMKEAQQLTTEVVLDAHKRMAAGIASDFDQMEKTVARATMELSNAWKDVIGDANRAGSGTKDLATVISGLATTITENKQTISDVFSGLIKGARLTIETIADVSRSIQGLAIVAASKDKSLTDWIMGDANTMKQWQTEIGNGTAFLKDRLVEVREKISDTADSWGKWSDKRDTLAALREEEKKLMAAIEERGKATGKANSEAATSATTAAVSVSTFKDSWQTKRDLTISMAKEITDAEVKAFAEADKAAKSSGEEKVKLIHLETDERMQKLQMQKQILRDGYDAETEARRKELEAWKQSSEGKLAMLDGLVSAQKTTTDTFVVLEELKGKALQDTGRRSREVVSEMERGWRDFAHGTQSTFASVIGDGLRGEFDSIGSAWNALLNGMVNAFINSVSNMAAQGMTDAIFGTSATSSKPATDGWVTPVFDAVESWWNSTEFYADGGTHSGGLRVVGERGPELEFTGPSTILSNTDSKKWMSSMSGAPSGGKVSDKFGALAQALQQAGMTASQAKTYIYEMSTATAVYTSELLNNGSSLGESIAQTSSSTNAVASHTEATRESTAATKSESNAKSKGTARSFDFTDALIDVTASIAESTARVGVAALGFGVLGAKAGELAASMTGLTGAFQGAVQGIKNAINDVQAYGWDGFDPNNAGDRANAYGPENSFSAPDPDKFGDATNGGWGGGDGGTIGGGTGSDNGTMSGSGGDQGGDSSDHGNDYATGGIHRGGWRLVGEQGPELEYTPPSRIFNNTDTQSIIGQSDKTASAISDLKEVVIGAIMASSEKMRRIENVVMRWEKTGLPAARA